jgi:spermidine synthase
MVFLINIDEFSGFFGMRGPRTLAPTLDAEPGKLPILSLSFPGHKWISRLSVGVYAALTPVIIRLIESLQIALWERYPVGVLSLSWVNILLVTAALIIPTTLMGGTLPVMTTYFVRHGETIGRHVARLYSLNTLGGAAGALIAGFFLISTFGMKGTIYGAAMINLASVYALTGRYAEAVEGFEHSLAINPDQPEVRERLRELQLRLR